MEMAGKVNFIAEGDGLQSAILELKIEENTRIPFVPTTIRAEEVNMLYRDGKVSDVKAQQDDYGFYAANAVSDAEKSKQESDKLLAKNRVITHSPVNVLTTKSILVEGGNFTMGSEEGGSDEKPTRQISLSSYKIAPYEVTNQQYLDFLNKMKIAENGVFNNKVMVDPSSLLFQIEYKNGSWVVRKGYEDYPVVMVTWNGANEYSKWVGGRLPTEAEWEYAAKGGRLAKGYRYAGSNNVEDVAWSGVDLGTEPFPVGTKKPNELGLYDMSGNVCEWCSDWTGSYSSIKHQLTNPTGNSFALHRIHRGASWSSNAESCSVTARNAANPIYLYDNVGFRPVFDIIK